MEDLIAKKVVDMIQKYEEEFRERYLDIDLCFA